MIPRFRAGCKAFGVRISRRFAGWKIVPVRCADDRRRSHGREIARAAFLGRQPLIVLVGDAATGKIGYSRQTPITVVRDCIGASEIIDDFRKASGKVVGQCHRVSVSIHDVRKFSGGRRAVERFKVPITRVGEGKLKDVVRKCSFAEKFRARIEAVGARREGILAAGAVENVHRARAILSAAHVVGKRPAIIVKRYQMAGARAISPRPNEIQAAAWGGKAPPLPRNFPGRKLYAYWVNKKKKQTPPATSTAAAASAA